MSDETEMVTIELPVGAAEDYARAVGEHPLAHAIRKALAARKSKYERWREGLPVRNIFAKLKGQSDNEGILCAAGPKLVQALIGIRRAWLEGTDGQGDCPELEAVDDAIRAATPADVAAEILGE